MTTTTTAMRQLTLILPCALAAWMAGPALAQSADGVNPAADAEAAAKAAAKAAMMERATHSLDGIEIIRGTLGNGMRVVLSPDRSIPNVGIAVYYDVGSRNEAPGRSGFAHLFEHMMFQGSENVGKGEHFQYIMNRGGTMNGTTSTDRTNYYEALPSNELELGLWLEADRMRSLSITAENFENQRQTVMEERRQSYDNQPYMKSMLEINELAYGDYWPYAHSTIGDMQDLIDAPLQAVQEFFAQYYAPNNAILSIAGDFDTQQALGWIHKHFGFIEPREVPTFNPPEFTPPTSPRVSTTYDPIAELPAFHVAYPIPPRTHPDHHALEILAIVLGDGKASRLYRELVRSEEICQEVQVSTDNRRGPDLFSMWAILGKRKRTRTALRIIDTELGDVFMKGISESEMEKAKNKIRARFLFGMQSNLSRAKRLAEYELYWGDAEAVRQELERYMQVTDRDIKRVAREYLDRSRRTILSVVPGPDPNAETESLPSTEANSNTESNSNNSESAK